MPSLNKKLNLNFQKPSERKSNQTQSKQVPHLSKPQLMDNKQSQQPQQQQESKDIEQNYNEIVETFEELNLNSDLLRGIFAYGFERPSAIQQKAIKPVIECKDTIAQAQSGTGKTGTFVISTLQRIDPQKQATQAIILAPVRELAKQIFDVLKGIGQFLNIEFFCCIGGTSMQETKEKCKKGVHVIVATPGRLIDMIRNKFLDTTHLKLFVVDEADQMLDRGFVENIKEILQSIPGDVQIALFSATFPQPILELTQQFMREGCAKILVKKEQLTLQGITQFYVAIEKEEDKYQTLVELYKNLTVAQSIVFCNSKKTVDDLTDKLRAEGFIVSKIHSQMEMKDREQVMVEFKNGAARILVSTDLMGRGIDIHQLSLVINYEFPKLKESYLHRVGRAGRYGRKGVGINLVSQAEANNLIEVEKFYSTKIDEMPMDLAEVEKDLTN